jgi:hypothetical protein
VLVRFMSHWFYPHIYKNILIDTFSVCLFLIDT